MTTKDFLDALSRVGNDPSFETINNDRKRTEGHSKKPFIALVAVLVAVIGTAVIFYGLSAKKAHNPSPKSNGDVLINNKSNGVSEAPVLNPTDNHSSVQTPEPSKVEAGWFDNSYLSIRQLSYSGIDSTIVTLNSDNHGVRHISAEVKGEHADCPGCYYNAETGEVICLYHEFLAVSGIKIEKGYGLRFYADHTRDDLVAVRLYDERSVLTKGLWIYNRKTGTAAETGLPERCSSYEELYVYENCLWNGKLAVGLNSAEGIHCTYILDTDTRKAVVVPGTENNEWSSASFIGDNILLLTSDEYSFLNIDTGVRVKVIGEYNYFTDGKVFSVKNWGWANHNDVEVAVYDAATGAVLDNETVLVKTVLDDGTNVFLAKKSTNGEETVIVDNYDQNAYTWNGDYSYFYAFSSAGRKLVCYSSKDGKWFANQAIGISAESVTVDGKEYSVDASYALAVSDSNNDVTIYYSRVFDETLVLPDYEDEKVDSPYWDNYREIKAANFDGKDHFSMWIDRNTVGINVKDMTWLRDEILSIRDGNRIDRVPDQADNDHLKLEIRCGSADILFIEYEDACYAYLGYNMLAPVGGHGYAEEMYEIPRALIESVVGYYNETYNSGKWY
jgi:hypothetical protein